MSESTQSSVTSSVVTFVIEEYTDVLNDRTRKYNVGTDISLVPSARFDLPVYADDPRLDRIGEIGKSIVLGLQSRIPGLKLIEVERCSVTLDRYIAFPMDGMNDLAIEVFFEVLEVPLAVRHIRYHAIDRVMYPSTDVDCGVFGGDGTYYPIEFYDELAVGHEQDLEDSIDLSMFDDPDSPPSQECVDGRARDDDVEHFDGRVGGWPEG